MIPTVREYLKKNILIFDGAMGTYYAGRGRHLSAQCELANLNEPREILNIQKAYIKAGAVAIKTNTFALNPVNYPEPSKMEELISAGYRIACEAAGEEAYVFADIGPVWEMNAGKRKEMLGKVTGIFLDLGAENFLFETQGDTEGIPEAIRMIRSRREDAFVIVSFAVSPDGFSINGIHIKELAGSVPEADAVGMNCTCVPVHMRRQLGFIPKDGRPVSIMPNGAYAGGSNSYYEANPRFFAEEMRRIAQDGVSILGGCCGTTPEHIRMLAEEVAGMEPSGLNVTEETATKLKNIRVPKNRLDEKIAEGKRVICVEFDPPKDADLDAFMEGARELKEAGIDAMTIADCPIARVSVDSSLLACKVKRELDLDVIPHMTCRDRNMNASKALLLGLYGEGVRNVLLVTGDPIPLEERESMKGVFQFDSVRFARYVNAFAERELNAPFSVYGALNVNALNFKVELEHAQRKLDAGVKGFLTQPVMTEYAVDNVRAAKETLKDALILGGIMPVLSERNARYMHEQISGIRLEPETIERFAGLDRQQGEELGLRLAVEWAKMIRPWTDGYYLITPFRRTGLMARLVKTIRTAG